MALESALTLYRAKRALLVVGLVLLAVGFAAHMNALVTIGCVLAVVGFIGSGGA